jgi:hypothetical protein
VSVHLPADAIRVLADETDAGDEEAPVAAGDGPGRQDGELAQR